MVSSEEVKTVASNVSEEIIGEVVRVAAVIDGIW